MHPVGACGTWAALKPCVRLLGPQAVRCTLPAGTMGKPLYGNARMGPGVPCTYRGRRFGGLFFNRGEILCERCLDHDHHADSMNGCRRTAAGRSGTPPDGLLCRDTPAGELSAGVLSGRCRQPDGTTRVVDLLSEAPPTSLMVTVTT
jgi:hypothetical protein